MSAVRMVAYGVLEMKHKRPPDPYGFNPADEKITRQEDFERDQLRQLVNAELLGYGLLLTRKVVPHGVKYRTKANAHILYGQVIAGGFSTREVLHEGDFKECCEAAAKLLDKLPAAQVPDIRTSPDET